MTGRQGDWSAERTEDGTWTLRSSRIGEACHNRVGAWTEALERYAVPCGLRERAVPGATLRVLDVGTGVGWNLAAALEVCVAGGARLEAVTLESDPEVIRASIRLAGERAEPEAEGGNAPSAATMRWRAVLDGLAEALSDTGRPEGELGQGVGVRRGTAPLLAAPGGPPAGRLTLLLGDARSTLETLDGDELFDAVFLDPFSPRRAPELWESGFLAALARRMAPGSWLSTYTVSRAVRGDLARAGLRVGRGPACGPKREGTLASPDLTPPPLEEGGRDRPRGES